MKTIQLNLAFCLVFVLISACCKDNDNEMTTGFNCIDGDCKQVSLNPTFTTLDECQDMCKIEEEIVFYPGEGVTFDDYSYSSIVLGNGQEWMAENLKTAIFVNGDSIPNVKDRILWGNLNNGAWVHYDNDNQNENTYGKLYNWFAVDDPRNLCPPGWRVPSDEDWTELVDYLGGDPVAGGKMKSTGTDFWQSPNNEATNESGFTGLPGDRRFASGTFPTTIGQYGYWWSSTGFGSSAWFRFLQYSSGYVDRFTFDKEEGLSVRCLKD